MELNKENALRLWNKQIGKKNKGVDFAGREIAKAAYNDRNSKYGWNVDHIMPASRGGKTADHNLICCNIKTNDEKADRFPAFKANGKAFEIRKRENHYEIFDKAENEIKVSHKKESQGINFMDSAQGISFWNKCKENSEEFWLGYVKIKISSNNLGYDLSCVIEKFRTFIGELFSNCTISSEKKSNHFYAFGKPIYSQCEFTVLDFDIPLQKDIENLLNLSIILNTYSQAYFKPKYSCEISIYCGAKVYQSKSEVSLNDIENNLRGISFEESLAIDELVKINSSADEEIDWNHDGYGFYPYNYTFKKLEKNLQKL